MLQDHTPPTSFKRSRCRALAMQAVVVGLFFFSASVGRADAAGAAEPGISGTKATDHHVVQTLQDLGVALVRGPVSGPSSGAHALVRAEESPMLMHLWVDSGHSSITLVRAADGHLLTREVARDTFVQAPYAAALMATEMVELMRDAPYTDTRDGRADADDLRAQADTQGETLAFHQTVARTRDVPAVAALTSTVRFSSELSHATTLSEAVAAVFAFTTQTTPPTALVLPEAYEPSIQAASQGLA